MRAKPGIDFRAMRFELDVVELATARLDNDIEKFETLKEGIIEVISDLPLSVNMVARERDYIEKVTSSNFWMKFTDYDLDEMVQRLAPLMKYRDQNRPVQVKTDLMDLLTVKEYIEFGPEHERLTTDKYRQRVEALIHELVRTNSSLQKLMDGDELSNLEIRALAKILRERHPNVMEDILKNIYDNRHAKFIQFIKHILEVEPFATFTETVSLAFDDFIRRHNDFSQQQIQFLLILKTFILQRGKIAKRDLVNAPFTQIHPQGIRGIFVPIAIIESSESSNRLEGITAPHQRIENIVLKSTEPKNKSEQEIAGYRDALNLIHESAQYMGFSVNVILQLHSIIHRYMSASSGHWKMADNEIVEKDGKGNIIRVRFKPTSAVATPHTMEKLVQDYKQAIQQFNKEPLVILPLTILDFLCIHPFRDGNGRVARLLTLLLLYHFGYEVGKYISLERIFEESKETYYESLEKSSIGWHQGKHDPFPWMNYFWGTMIRAYREFEDRVGNIRSGKGSKTDQIVKAVEKRINPFSISDIERDCAGISRDMVRNVLRQLRDQGKIVLQGKGRSAKWLYKGK